jgi:hypothetical protein
MSYLVSSAREISVLACFRVPGIFIKVANFPIESGRDEAITTKGQETNNWTKVSNYTLVSAGIRPIDPGSHLLKSLEGGLALSNFAPNSMHSLDWPGRGP